MNEMNRQRAMQDWNLIFELIKKNQCLEKEEREQIQRGVSVLREVLGDRWLRESYQESSHVFSLLTSEDPSDLLEAALLGEKLGELRSVSGFQALQKRLMNPKEYDAAKAELEIASRLKNRGFTVELNPKVADRNPDIKAIVSRKAFYFEVATLREAELTKKAIVTVNSLIDPFISDREIKIACRFYKTLSVAHLKELQEKIRKGIKEAKTRQVSIDLSEPGVIDYVIVPLSKREEWSFWMSKKEIPGGFVPPPLGRDLATTARRIMRTFTEENKQLPMDKPGIIIVYTQPLILGGNTRAFYQSLASEVRETIYEHENLVFGVTVACGNDAILTDGCKAEWAIKKDKGDYVLITRSPAVAPFGAEDVLIVRNKYSRFCGYEVSLSIFD